MSGRSERITGSNEFIQSGEKKRVQPSIASKNLHLTSNKVANLPLPKSSEKNEGFSRKIDLLAGKTSKVSALFDIQDSSQSAMRNTATLVQHVVGQNEVFGHVSAVDGTICNLGYMVVRGLAFRTALQKWPLVWKYGDTFDKLDALTTIFRTGVSTLSSSLGVAKNIGAIFMWTALALPATICSILFLTIWAMKAIVNMGRLLSNYAKLNQAFDGMSDKEKLQSLVNYMDLVDQQLEKESDELRGSEYMSLKKELEDLDPNEEKRKMNILERLEQLKEESPEREGYLKERRLVNLMRKYGAGGLRRIKEYPRIKADLEKFDALKLGLENDFQNGNISEEIYQEKLSAVGEMEQRYIKKAIGWFNDVKSAMRNGMGIQVSLLLACIFGIIAGVFLLLTAKFWLPIALGIAILGSVMWIIYDAKMWGVQTEVTKHQKRWVKELLSHYVEQENLINERNVSKFENFFFTRDDIESHVITKRPLKDRVTFVKQMLKERILQDSTLDEDIDHHLINYLTTQNTEKLPLEDRDQLRHKIDKMILSLGVSGEHQEEIRHQLQTIRFIEEGLRKHQKDIHGVIENRHYKLDKFNEEMKAFVDDYSKQLFETLK